MLGNLQGKRCAAIARRGTVIGKAAGIACALALAPLPVLAGDISGSSAPTGSQESDCTTQANFEWGCWHTDADGKVIDPPYINEDEKILNLISTFKGRGTAFGEFSAAQGVLRNLHGDR